MKPGYHQLQDSLIIPDGAAETKNETHKKPDLTRSSFVSYVLRTFSSPLQRAFLPLPS